MQIEVSSRQHLGTWSVIDGEYFVSVGFVENGISTVNELNLADCMIETNLRFSDTEVGFRAGIVISDTLTMNIIIPLRLAMIG